MRQLGPRNDPSGRIVRVREQENPCASLERRSQPYDVDRALVEQRNLLHDQSGRRQVGDERSVRRRRERHRAVLPDEQPCQFEYPDHHVRHKPDLLGIHPPPQPAGGEPGQRLREAGDVGLGVTQVVLIDSGVEGCGDRRRDGEVHLGDRGCQNVGGVAVPLHAAPGAQSGKRWNVQVGRAGHLRDGGTAVRTSAGRAGVGRSAGAPGGTRTHTRTLLRGLPLPIGLRGRRPQPRTRGQALTFRSGAATRSNSAFGSLICPRDTTSRPSTSAPVQSNTIRIRRFQVGMRLTW